MEKLLEIKNLRVSYHTYAGEVQSVRGVSFDLYKGETVAIVGESGCGKSVTSKAILGLIQTPPGEIKKDSKILYKNKNIFDFSSKEWKNYRGAEASIIFQDALASLNPTMTIGNQIAENIIIHQHLKKTEAMNEATKMLKVVGIANPEKRINQYPHELSGGMRQRVMIAIALACNPSILIADEPTTALDVTIQAQILDLIKELQKKNNAAVIMITHDLGVVADIADRILVMYSGKIIERGTSRDIFYSPKHPYTWALLNAAPKLNDKSRNRLISIEGTPPDLFAPPKGCPFYTRCKYCMPICIDEEPEDTNINNSHQVKCWLQHELAENDDIPFLKGDFKIEQ